uniref:Globin domain-containing protein n=1 Tax=Haplochromis burtoni TaxID=8153 RepID=A0A3Q2VZ45_HAPBU
MSFFLLKPVFTVLSYQNESELIIWDRYLSEHCSVFEANQLFIYSLRCLIVYPWTKRYFGGFGNLYNAAAITSNPRVASHGKVIMEALEKAVKDMDNIKATYAELSALHSEKLQVDPDNFMVCIELMVLIFIVMCVRVEDYISESRIYLCCKQISEWKTIN